MNNINKAFAILQDLIKVSCLTLTQPNMIFDFTNLITDENEQFFSLQLIGDEFDQLATAMSRNGDRIEILINGAWCNMSDFPIEEQMKLVAILEELTFGNTH